MMISSMCAEVDVFCNPRVQSVILYLLRKGYVVDPRRMLTIRRMVGVVYWTWVRFSESGWKLQVVDQQPVMKDLTCLVLLCWYMVSNG
jgi:hypothetical protein